MPIWWERLKPGDLAFGGMLLANARNLASIGAHEGSLPTVVAKAPPSSDIFLLRNLNFVPEAVHIVAAPHALWDSP